jgi:hypothetical protein
VPHQSAHKIPLLFEMAHDGFSDKSGSACD